jgi:cytochrome c oxidase subunit 2
VRASAALLLPPDRCADRGARAREIEITLKRWGVEPARIEVTQGDAVKLTVKSLDSVHGFEIKKLKINKEVPKGGKPIVVEFVPNTAGEFDITCSEYCGKGHKEMKGLLVVKPKS